MSDASATMGTLLPAEVVGRDAVHVAVFAMVATVKVYPGQNVDKDGTPIGTKVGIVDPFLTCPQVYPGERYWLFLYPRSITALRHEWTHPDFPDTPAVVGRVPKTSAKKVSEAWIRDYALSQVVPYETLLGAIATYIDTGDEDDYITIQDYDLHTEIPELLWHHAKIVLGRTFYVKHRPTYFSCSC